ncbi:xanthine dehydrogenase accessory protein XdhC [Paracoccus albus]|uniref:xanthine dehydrogenase accessory protein XdhC n=1 Tax=Paracoccus albus TaxID=3017784 RepID=UPI0022F0E48E|nr:xanthine dehydrogenase accessory protein XdhC [Paracoccus albus]WBU60676.1 xanthine dehydrogenase accessory protein XdhC [Paracoccus albus]
MIRVRIKDTQGSTPRDVGAEMFVSAAGSSGTIGGGRLEFDAIGHARKMLRNGEDQAVTVVTLGPETGQCCGGRVTLEFDKGAPAAHPLPPQVLIFGAGHVGRALARTMALLPFEVTLFDERTDEIAKLDCVRTVATPLPELAIRDARPGAAFVVMTHDHGLDFTLTAEALGRTDAAYVGLIGSATKRARFLREARLTGIDCSGLTCPIGANYSSDKRPEVIAAFTAAEIASKLTVNATVD